MDLQGSVFAFKRTLPSRPTRLKRTELPSDLHSVKSNMCFLVLALFDLWKVSDIGDTPLQSLFFSGYVTKLIVSILGSRVGFSSSVCPSRIGVAKDSMFILLPSFRQFVVFTFNHHLHVDDAPHTIADLPQEVLLNQLAVASRHAHQFSFLPAPVPPLPSSPIPGLP